MRLSRVSACVLVAGWSQQIAVPRDGRSCTSIDWKYDAQALDGKDALLKERRLSDTNCLARRLP